MECMECHVGHMQIPKDEHPSYVVCDSCGAMELTYVHAPYQKEMHTVPYQMSGGNIRPQIIGVFGG